jgi:hypothetical protein
MALELKSFYPTARNPQLPVYARACICCLPSALTLRDSVARDSGTLQPFLPTRSQVNLPTPTRPGLSLLLQLGKSAHPLIASLTVNAWPELCAESCHQADAVAVLKYRTPHQRHCNNLRSVGRATAGVGYRVLPKRRGQCWLHCFNAHEHVGFGADSKPLGVV